MAPRLEDKTSSVEKEISNEDASDEEDQPVVDFEDQSYELTQTYQLGEEYQDMTAEQEAAEVQMIMLQEQAEYRKMMKLHRRQAEMEKKMMGLSHIVKERMKARTPGIPVDLIQRSVEPEVSEKQELQKLSETQ